MTPLEALDITMECVRDLQGEGIVIELRPYQDPRPDTIAKFSGPERIPHDKWVTVRFAPNSQEQAEAIARAADGLGWRGISFDTGGGMGVRDWSLDWSFRVQDGPNSDTEHARSVVEELIQGLEA